jgi:hypothetical protein
MAAREAYALYVERAVEDAVPPQMGPYLRSGSPRARPRRARGSRGRGRRAWSHHHAVESTMIIAMPRRSGAWRPRVRRGEMKVPAGTITSRLGWSNNGDWPEPSSIWHLARIRTLLRSSLSRPMGEEYALLISYSFGLEANRYPL